jgi:hypothetical protein
MARRQSGRPEPSPHLPAAALAHLQEPRLPSRRSR